MVALRSVSVHPKSRVFFQSAGLADCKKAETLDFIQEQLQTMVATATETTKRQGRANDDRRAFVEALVMAISDAQIDDGITKKKTPTILDRIKLLGLPRSTGYRLFKKQAKKKKDI